MHCHRLCSTRRPCAMTKRARAARTFLLVAAIVLASVAPCHGRFFYHNFLDTSNLALSGDADTNVDDACLSLTNGPAASSEAVGAVFYDRALDLSSGFNTAFSFSVLNGSASGASAAMPSRAQLRRRLRSGRDDRGGNGLAFVLQGKGPSAVGGGGSQLGYGGLGPGLAVEFDTVLDGDERDPNGNHVSVHIAVPGTGAAGAGLLTAYESSDARIASSLPFDIRGGSRLTVQITLRSGVLSVFVNDLVRPLLSIRLAQTIMPVSTSPGDDSAASAASDAAAAALASLLKGPLWVGFTASADEDSADRHQLCDWFFDRRSYPQPGSGAASGPGVVARETCDEGFAGDTCMVDARLSVHECALATHDGCVRCTSHTRDCRWCHADSRCVSGTQVDAADALQAANAAAGRGLGLGGSATNSSAVCSDHSSFTRLAERCMRVPESLVTVWSAVLVLLASALAAGLIGQACGTRRWQLELSTFLLVGVAGAALALSVAAAVNWVLMQVTLSPVAAFLAGLLLIATGGLLGYQTFSAHFGSDNEGFSGSVAHFLLLLLFACLMAVSGVACFLLEKDWTRALSAKGKVPLYALLGVSICFALVLYAYDLLSCLPRLVDNAGSESRPLVRSVVQVRLLALTAAVCGCYFGLVFGLLDVQDMTHSHIRLALARANFYIFPFSSLLGALVACCNHWLATRFVQPVQLKTVSLPAGGGVGGLQHNRQHQRQRPGGSDDEDDEDDTDDGNRHDAARDRKRESRPLLSSSSGSGSAGTRTVAAAAAGGAAGLSASASASVLLDYGSDDDDDRLLSPGPGPASGRSRANLSRQVAGEL